MSDPEVSQQDPEDEPPSEPAQPTTELVLHAPSLPAAPIAPASPLLPARPRTIWGDAESQALEEGAEDLEREALAENSRLAYASVQGQYLAWCEEKGHAPLSADVVRLYLSWRAALTEPVTLAKFQDPDNPRRERLRQIKPLKASSYGVVMAGICDLFSQHEVPLPTGEVRVTRVLQGIRRKKRSDPKKSAAVTHDVLQRLLATLPDSPRGLRDRALLLVGYYGGLRRSEIAAIDVAHISEVRQYTWIFLPKSKTDQAGVGVTMRVPKDPVGLAIGMWLTASGISDGPIFRQIKKGGVLGARLSGRSIANIVDAIVTEAKVRGVTSHGLRRGLITDLAYAGVKLPIIREKSRHKTLTALQEYLAYQPDDDDPLLHIGKK